MLSRKVNAQEVVAQEESRTKAVMEFTLWLDKIPPSTNSIKRWMTPDREEFYALIALAAKRFRLPTHISDRVVLDIVLVWPDARRRDADNHIKCLEDGLVRAGVLIDDNLCYPRVIYAFTSSEAHQLPVEYRGGGVWLRLASAPSDLAYETAKLFMAPRVTNTGAASRSPATTSKKRTSAAPSRGRSV